MNPVKRGSLRNRTIAAIWAIVRGQGKDEAWFYGLASEEMGRLLQGGFGITTCTDQELGRILLRVKRALGLPVQEYRRGTRDEGRGTRQRTPKPLRSNGEVRVSLAQARLERDLIQELHLSGGEVEGIFTRATGKYFSSAMADHTKFIAGLQSVKRRRRAACGGAAVSGAAVSQPRTGNLEP
jgi:hypothetical protein